MAYKQTLAGCLALVIYVLLGGLLFSELEGEHESNSRNVIQNILLNLSKYTYLFIRFEIVLTITF